MSKMFDSNHKYTDYALILLALQIGTSELLYWFDDEQPNKYIAIRVVYLACFIIAIAIQVLKNFRRSYTLYKWFIIAVSLVRLSLRIAEIVLAYKHPQINVYDP